MSSPTIAQSDLDLPLVVTQLMKGVVHQDTHAKAWRHLLQLQAQVRDYVATMGLIVVIDEAEGYAFLRSRVDEGEDEDSTRSGPQRLIARRSLPFSTSLLLALLRKRLAEFDVTDSGTRCVLSRDQIVELLRVFIPERSNEAKLVDQVDITIGKVVDLGFLRRVKDEKAMFEIRRILKAFVDAQWLAHFDEELAKYAVAVGAGEPEGEVPA
ncbi:MAG TPA: DUF4194 domain-containing protein [Kineosporiaceae bacterium]|nr:DUF4194 domain-containing protein [Kineosporiaceae bacterium]